MSVRDRCAGLQLFLVVRGAVLSSSWTSLALTALLAAAVTSTDGNLAASSSP